jgi:DNA excision repair protein ERCC-3
VSEFFTAELSVLLNCGRGTASVLAHRAWTYRGNLPRTWAALRAGQIDERRARDLADVLAHAAPGVARAVEGRLLGEASSLSLRRLRARAQELLLELDATGADERRDQAHLAADVRIYPEPAWAGRPTAAVPTEGTAVPRRYRGQSGGARPRRGNPPSSGVRVNDGPLIVQSDKTLLLEVDHPQARDCRAAIAPFAELERSPEHVHTYRVTPLALWNARAAGHDAEQVVDALVRYSRYPVPHALLVDVADTMDRYGRLTLQSNPVHGLVLTTTDRAVLEEVVRSKRVAPMLGQRIDDDTVVVHPSERGRLKQALLKVGWPAEDLAGYVDGQAHPIDLKQDGWHLRDYQQEAVEGFWAGGSGVVVLPCGAGKTLVGAAAMAEAKATTLILVTNTVAGRQWKRELMARTSLTEDEIGEYSGERKEIRPVTIATYQVMTTRRKGEYRHLDLFDAQDWGLIVYDEVHLLPAPIFRLTADLQSRRRLGLTATLVREDGREDDVFSLIGPKRYDAPWKDIESQGYIAPAECIEVRVSLDDEERMTYAVAEPEERYRIAATASSKLPVIRRVLERHPQEQKLVIGAYLDQLEELGAALDAPVIQGSTTNRERERLFDQFRSGELTTLVVSKVANFSIDLPEAAVAVQVSGTFGSRQEEAQRLGRVLRPKADGRQAHFYTVVSRDTLDSEYAAHRQRFLAEQGYAYTIVDAADLAGLGEVNGPDWTDEPAD